MTEETFKAYHQNSGIVIIHLTEEDMIHFALKNPLAIVASDSLLMGGKGHPLRTGAFSRVSGQYVREKKTLTMEALRKVTLIPGQGMEGRVPAMKN